MVALVQEPSVSVIQQGFSSVRWGSKQVLNVGADFSCGAAPVTGVFPAEEGFGCIGWGRAQLCSRRVWPPAGTVAVSSPRAPLLLLFLVLNSFSGSCLLELLCLPVVWDCLPNACPHLWRVFLD